MKIGKLQETQTADVGKKRTKPFQQLILGILRSPGKGRDSAEGKDNNKGGQQIYQRSAAFYQSASDRNTAGQF